VQTKPSHTARATKVRIQVPQDSKTKGHHESDGEMEPREIGGFLLYSRRTVHLLDSSLTGVIAALAA
jgi:hypothetical protein